MRFRRNPLVHIVMLIIVVSVSIVGITSNHFGIRSFRGQGSRPTATPTPISREEEYAHLAAALKLRQQGRYEEAISTLEPVIYSADLRNASEALFETARNRMALGDLTGAKTALQQVRSKYATTPAADESVFLLAQIEASTGDLASAIDDYQSYGKRHPEIAAYVDLLIARWEEQRGHLSQALERASRVAASPPIPRAQVEAFELMRDVQKKRNDNAAYLDSTNRLLRLATISSYRAELTYQRASVELKLGLRDQAVSDLRAVVNNYPDSGYASNAISDLQKLLGPTAVADSTRGIVDYYDGQYQTAESVFDTVLTADPANDQAWYYRSMTRLRNGDSWAAAIQLRSMAERFPSSTLTPGAVYTAGKLFEESGDIDRAISAYDTLIRQFPTSADATDARLRAGLLHFEKGEYQAAIAVLAPVDGPSSAEAQASFWEGKSEQRLGNDVRAKQAWTYASEADSTGYYGLRAAQLIQGGQPKLTANVRQTLDQSLTPQQQGSLDTWFANQGTTQDASLEALHRDHGYQRMALLYELGLETQADWEMSALAERYSGDPALLAALGQALNQGRHYNATYRVGVKLEYVAANEGLSLPLALQRLAYPLAFPDLVQTHADAHDIDPLLYLALVRQESGYDPAVTSSAGARGLSQVMPSTGQDIARSLHISDFNADMLYRPAVAVQMGELYLADRLRRYDGQIFPALAGYNAGDGNVQQWLAHQNSTDPDVFVEQIPFSETHSYVQIVYANYLNYLRLYRAR